MTNLTQLPFRVDELELSVRSSNVLRLAGVTTIEEFARLTKDQVMGFANAGRKTWNEIEEAQAWLLNGYPPRDYSRARAVVLINHLNAILSEAPDLRVAVEAGRIVLLLVDPAVHTYPSPAQGARAETEKE